MTSNEKDATKHYFPHHAVINPDKASTKVTVGENIYVGNVVSGKDTLKEAVEFYIEAKKIFRKASMNLREWMSNNNSVIKEIPSDDRANQGPMKILGLTWYIERLK